ncbi:MAG: hypothetical protein HN921_04035 [Bacteroidetes bacterium]|mgnify:FL=1|jgi:hypothetical protein|nr:hypothetical protein [Bacteroidota bacterium]MBT5529446.1 hypothetical protein [Cytophagia bacterium]MBT3423643.1 hypothetical protein [Bacteroidota bacterium]MBT4730274.1 hypothetical protein [Bacteroidota bacterium]MBT7038989.1 hypothetical protein [Bacteroidota bacterium]
MIVNGSETVSSATDVNELHFDQRLWINKIRLHKDELVILQENLDKMVKYYSNEEFMSEIEQYQNKIIVYREVADRLIKDYKILRNKIVELNGSAQGSEEGIKLDNANKELSNRAAEFLDFLGDLKDNFLNFYTTFHVSDNHVFGK